MVARVSDIVSELTETTTLSLDEAMKQGIAGERTLRRTLRNLCARWIKEERVYRKRNVFVGRVVALPITVFLSSPVPFHLPGTGGTMRQ